MHHLALYTVNIDRRECSFMPAAAPGQYQRSCCHDAHEMGGRTRMHQFSDTCPSTTRCIELYAIDIAHAWEFSTQLYLCALSDKTCGCAAASQQQFMLSAYPYPANFNARLNSDDNLIFRPGHISMDLEQASPTALPLAGSPSMGRNVVRKAAAVNPVRVFTRILWDTVFSGYLTENFV